MQLRLKSLAAGLLIAAALPHGAEAATAPSIEVVSNRADLISAGDALVAIALPVGVDPSRVRVSIATT